MKTLATALPFAILLFTLSGCPEKKPEGDGANSAAKPAGSEPTAAPKPAPSGGGW